MSASSASTNFQDILQKSRHRLIVTAAVSIISTGVALMACLVAAHCMSQADDLPYRQAAGVFIKLAAIMSALGFASVCGFLVSLRPISRRLAEAAQDRASED
jgi:hypothetical protein